MIGLVDEKNTITGSSGTINLWSPYTTLMYKISGRHSITSITVKVSDHVTPQVAEKNTIGLLTGKHGGIKDFFTIHTDSIRRTVENATGTLRLLVSGIVLISPVVGGIIMNIMLVSVTERTWKIRILGADQHSILTQFQTEAVLISSLGAFIGIIFSFLIGFGTYFFIASILMVYSVSSVVLALVCSTAIGILFGFMPARNASKLSPIEALARE